MLQALLENESINEAIELTEHSGGAGMSSDKYAVFTQRVFQKAGFIKLAHGNYQEAQEYFLSGKLDVREVRGCYYTALCICIIKNQFILFCYFWIVITIGKLQH